MLARPRCLWAFVLVLALVPAGASHASDGETIGPPRYSRGWMHLRTGITFADGLVLDNGSLGLESNGDPAFVFGLGAHWRTSRIDLGVLFEALSSYAFSGLERDNRVGSQYRIAADLRWRYIEDHWGALFLRLTPGLAVLTHADPMRFQVAELVGGDLDAVDQHNIGFSLGFDFGVLIYLTERLAIAVDLDIVSSMTSLDTDVQSVDLDMVRGVFAISAEWRM